MFGLGGDPIASADSEDAMQTCMLHFVGSDGYCRSTLQVFKATRLSQKDALLAATLAELQAASEAKGETIAHTDDPANPHVCAVRPPSRLDELRAKPWSSLTLAEQTEATDLAFAAGQAVPAITAKGVS